MIFLLHFPEIGVDVGIIDWVGRGIVPACVLGGKRKEVEVLAFDVDSGDGVDDFRCAGSEGFVDFRVVGVDVFGDGLQGEDVGVAERIDGRDFEQNLAGVAVGWVEVEELGQGLLDEGVFAVELLAGGFDQFRGGRFQDLAHWGDPFGESRCSAFRPRGVGFLDSRQFYTWRGRVWREGHLAKDLIAEIACGEDAGVCDCCLREDSGPLVSGDEVIGLGELCEIE